MKIGIHSKVTLITVLVALPFAVSGGCIWRDGVAAVQSTETSFYYYDFLGGAAYTFFGFPLTSIALRLISPLAFDQHWWQLPTLSALVILQWIIWANLALWIGRIVIHKQSSKE